VKDALGNVTLTSYDLAGRVTRETDALGRSTLFEYDAVGQLISKIFPDPDTDDGDDSNNPRVRCHVRVQLIHNHYQLR
jgi:YD repeat-containing protein